MGMFNDSEEKFKGRENEVEHRLRVVIEGVATAEGQARGELIVRGLGEHIKEPKEADASITQEPLPVVVESVAIAPSENSTQESVANQGNVFDLSVEQARRAALSVYDEGTNNSEQDDRLFLDYPDAA